LYYFPCMINSISTKINETHRTHGMHMVKHDHKISLSRHHRKDHLEDLGMKRNKTLKYILEKQSTQILTAG
jgi:hypothetical protein